MNRWRVPSLLLGMLLAAPAAANQGLDAAFEAAMQRFHLPGLAVGVIENGRVVYKRTQGELIVGSGRKIDSNTLFKIASNSKAMTASTLARLVDAGKLKWDDAVVTRLPSFRMFDPWVTRNLQIGDLLVHNSGLPEGGGDLMLWPEPNHFTRSDIIAGLGHIKPAYSFRSGYAYDNLLYVVAGEVAAAVAGLPYEALVKREVFDPLGLDCRVGEWQVTPTDNIAQPHVWRDGRNVPSSVDEGRVPVITSAAAGGIRCSLDAMLKWAGNWLDPDAKHLEWLSVEQRKLMWTARTPMPISDWRKAHGNTHFYAYAYGFRLADVDGQWTVSHTGTLSGMYSVMMLLPDRKSGFVMMTNGEGDAARTVLTDVLTRYFTRPGQAQSVTALADELEQPRTSTTETDVVDTAGRIAVAPAEATNRLGVWRDPWFGEVQICAKDGEVRFGSLKSPMLSGRVVHVGKRWLVDWDDDAVDLEAWLDFPAGEGPQQMRMAKVDPEGDFSFDYEDLAFTRTAECPNGASLASANFAGNPTVSNARSASAAGMLDVARLSRGIGIDMRYAGADNFVGRPIDGYAKPRCLLKADAAAALARVQRALEKNSMRLHVFDCYRPARAVHEFVHWAKDPADQATRARHYPNLDKSALLGDYIAPVSGHSKGYTVDLSLEQCAPGKSACRMLDMGTPFDLFDPRANTDSPQITPEQRANRRLLRDAMQAEGFNNYPMEWWHFTHRSGADAEILYDFVIP
ncbi:MAG: hypothetical protein EYC71_09350 [Gammaproteobacteria bacterium]|nr:MAG: hypothetical protein EYC71_09350 [Gammaproteobacteria bacterium]